MQEIQRIEYLRTMGVECWIPKQSLAFAPEPRWIASTPQEPLHEEPVTPSIPSYAELLAENSHTPKVNAPKPNMPNLELNKHEGFVDKPTPKAQTAAVINDNVSATPNFELCFVRLTQDTLWVCDSLAQKTGLQKLVASIMRASKTDIDARMPIEFKWPYINNPRQDQSLSVAKRSLDAQWNILVRDGVTRCFAFGEQSKQWLSAYEVVFLAQDLTDVLQTAEAKRDLWHTLSEHSLFS